jgi:hypothetical protein
VGLDLGQQTATIAWVFGSEIRQGWLIWMGLFNFDSFIVVVVSLVYVN